MNGLRLGLAVATIAAPVAIAAGPAAACGGCDDGDITVRVSDTTPASGEQFIARGKLIIGGLPAADHVVRVQTKRDGVWVGLTGAHVTTNDDGKYRVRLILSQTGKRLLRVVGVGQGDEPNEIQRFTVRVH